MNAATVRGTVIDGLTVRAFDGEPMVLDVELATRLGYSNPIDIRKLIRRLLKEGILSDSDVFATVAKTSAAGGRPGVEYWLTESGALDVILASRTETARAIYRVVKQVFVAWRRGHLEVANTNANSGTVLATLDSLGKRVSFLEMHLATDGIITRPRLYELQTTVSSVARLEHDAGRWQCKRAATADIYRELREATGWGDKGQPWKLLPSTLAHAVFVTLRRREAAIVRELGVYARDRQTRLKLDDN